MLIVTVAALLLGMLSAAMATYNIGERRGYWQGYSDGTWDTVKKYRTAEARTGQTDQGQAEQYQE